MNDTNSSYSGGSPSKISTDATCMCAPAVSRCRNVASRAVRRSRLATRRFSHRTEVGQPSTSCVKFAHIRYNSDMNLSDPITFGRMYDEHVGGVRGAAYRILNNHAQAQDVAQDVFMKVWRNPQKFDARRGELGSYLRLMARSRALDLWREAQAAGRASDRLKVVVADEDLRPDVQPGPAAEIAQTR